MGHKKVCFSCRKAFSIYKNNSTEINLTCPECGSQTSITDHKFRPPEKDDIKRWQVAEFLKENGFFYDHAYEQIDTGTFVEVAYPDNMREAKIFVNKYKKLR